MTDKSCASRVTLLDVAPRALSEGERVGLPLIERDGEERGNEERDGE